MSSGGCRSGGRRGRSDRGSRLRSDCGAGRRCDCRRGRRCDCGARRRIGGKGRRCQRDRDEDQGGHGPRDGWPIGSPRPQRGMGAAAGCGDAGGGLGIAELGERLATAGRHADQERLGAETHDAHRVVPAERGRAEHVEDIRRQRRLTFPGRHSQHDHGGKGGGQHTQHFPVDHWLRDGAGSRADSGGRSFERDGREHFRGRGGHRRDRDRITGGGGRHGQQAGHQQERGPRRPAAGHAVQHPRRGLHAAALRSCAETMSAGRSESVASSRYSSAWPPRSTRDQSICGWPACRGTNSARATG